MLKIWTTVWNRVTGNPKTYFTEEDYERILFSRHNEEGAFEIPECLDAAAEKKLNWQLVEEKRMGRITFLGPNSGLIDETYHFDFKHLKDFNVTVGTKVTFIVYRRNENEDWIVRNVCPFTKYNDNEFDEYFPGECVERKCMVEECFNGSVVKRHGRIVSVKLFYKSSVLDDNCVNLNLDEIKAEFVPIAGDVVLLDVLVEFEQSCYGEVVDVLALKASRCGEIEGTITEISAKGDYGLIKQCCDDHGEDAILCIFSKSVCTPGYIPKEMDVVVCKVISSHSEESGTEYRALTVHPISQLRVRGSNEYERLQLFSSKKGIVVSATCKCPVIVKGEEAEFKVLIQNKSENVAQLTGVIIHDSGSNSIISLKTGIEYPVKIEGNQEFAVDISMTPHVIGQITEVIILEFGPDCKIGCMLDVLVDLTKDDGDGSSISSYNPNLKRFSRSRAFENVALPLGYRTIGNRFAKPQAFLPRKLGSYDVPQIYLNILFKDGKEISDFMNAKEALETISTGITDILTEKNYLVKFHALLYLEEVEGIFAIFLKNLKMYAGNPDMFRELCITIRMCQIVSYHMQIFHSENLAFTFLQMKIQVQQYNTDDAVFRTKDAYSVFRIENLSERKPTLVVGDKVTVYANDVQHTGTIEVVTANEIWTRFSETLKMDGRNASQQQQGGSSTQWMDGLSYKASFEINRTSTRTCHQAIDVVQRHLGFDWLFPNSLKNTKAPRVRICCEKPPENREEVRMTCCEKGGEEGTDGVEELGGREESKGVKSGASTEGGEEGMDGVEELGGREESKGVKSGTSTEGGEEGKDGVEKLGGREESEGVKSVVSTANVPLKMITVQELERSLLSANVESGSQDYADSVKSFFGSDKKGKGNQKIRWESDKDDVKGKGKVNAGVVGRSVVIEWVNSALNWYQKEAVRNVLKGEARPLPYVIFGPPGTGKTMTVVETVFQINKLIPFSRILIATPSNSSAELICERLLHWKQLQPGEMVRLVGYNYANVGRVSPLLLPYTVMPNITGGGDQEELDLVQNHADSVRKATKGDLGRYTVIVGTCAILGKLWSMGFPKAHFSHIIVDEAGQATEPEIMIPLSFLHEHGQAILAGDPLQLGPIVISRVAQMFGLEESLLARLTSCFPYSRDIQSFPDTDGYDPRLVTRLVYNYRSLPMILRVISDLFYDSKLVSLVCPNCSPEAEMSRKVSEGLDLPVGQDGKPCSILFHGIRGVNKRDEDDPSWYNDHEIASVIGYLCSLYREGLMADDVGVITPYRLQVKKIRNMLTELKVEAPKIGSVEEFQGQERSVVILSTVRSDYNLVSDDVRHTLGFVSSPQRLNVAISRARALIIIVGNPHLLVKDAHWRSILEFCVKNGCYVGCDRPDSG